MKKKLATFFKAIGSGFKRFYKFCTKTWWRAVISSVLILAIIASSVYVGYTLYAIGLIKHNDLSGVDLGRPTNLDELVIDRVGSLSNNPLDETITIALFGVDSRSQEYSQSNSDTIMIMSYNTVTGKIRLLSVMRDTELTMPNGSLQKANYAYAAGGPAYAIRMLNENFNIDISEYVTIDFAGFEDAVNAVGGVQISVKPEEIEEMNTYIRELTRIKGEDVSTAPQIRVSGKMWVNGRQALAFARIRKVGNNDYERCQRQFRVIRAVVNKVLTKSTLEYPKIVTKIAPYIETSLSTQEMISFATSAIGKDIKLKWYRFPQDDDIIITNTSNYNIQINLERTRRKMFDFLYFGKSIGTEKYKEYCIKHYGYY